MKVTGVTDAYAQNIATIKNIEKQPNQFSNGVFKYYYPSGELSEERTYYYGNLEGPTKKYYKNGKIESIKIYKENMVINERDFYQDGKLASEIASYNGKDLSTASQIQYSETGAILMHTANIHGTDCFEDDNPPSSRFAAIKYNCRDLRMQLKPDDPAMKVLTPSAPPTQ